MQFSHKTKATTDTTEEAEDNATLDKLNDDRADDGNEIEVNCEDENDELDPTVAESDAAMVDEVSEEVENNLALPGLTQADVNLGRFAVTKVMSC